MNPVETIDAAITSRKSCRAFTAQEVPRQTVMDILTVAARAPSGNNTQPWRVYVLQGAVRDALIARTCAAHDAIYADPTLAARYPDDYDYYPAQWPSPYIDRRRENGWGLYALLGIARGEKDRMHAQLQANYRFFGAPVGLMFTVHRSLARGSLVDYGMFLGNIMTAARARGLHTCAQAAWNGFSSIVKPLVGAGPEEMLVCGMALGHADTSARVNTYHTPREAAESFTRWVE